MKLFLNTVVAKKAVASLIDEKGKVVDQETAHEPLVAIEKLLKKNKIALADLDEISAHPGPGSFTGLRIGSAVVQTLNFVLGKKPNPPKIFYK